MALFVVLSAVAYLIYGTMFRLITMKYPDSPISSAILFAH
jgi:hypothetical protein